MIFLQTEPFYVISLEEVFWGVILLATTMIIHGFGMLLVLQLNHTVKTRVASNKNLASGLLPIVVASCLIMFVHLMEVLVWSGFFVWKNAFPSTSLAYYFSLNEYTTVGSKFSLPLNWRLLEGLIATSGLLAFAWSTGVLISLAHQFQDQRMDDFRQKHEKTPAKK